MSDRTLKDRARGAGITLAVALIAAAAAGGYVFYEMSTRVDAEAERADAAEAAAVATAAGFEAQIDVLNARLAEHAREQELVRSRLFVSIALDELDRRNFGSASDSLSSAHRALSAWCTEGSDCEVASVVAELATPSLEITDDLQSQRETLLDIGGAIDMEIARVIGEP